MKTHNIIKHLLSLIILSSFNCSSQTEIHSLQELWDLGKKNNIQMLSSESNKKIAQKNANLAYGKLLPTISVNGNFTDNITLQPTIVPASLFNPAAPSGTYSEITFGKRYNYNANIAAQLDIINPDDWFSIKEARIDHDIAITNGAVAKKNLYTQLANLYFSTLLLSDAEKIAQENIETTKKIFTISNDKFKDGLINEITLNTAQINYEQAIKYLSGISKDKQVQINNLQVLLNVSDTIILSNSFDEELIQYSNDKSIMDPSVALARLKVESSKNELNAALTEYLPTLSFVYQLNSQVATNEFLNFENNTTSPQQYWGLRLSIPILADNRRKLNLYKSRQEYDQSKKEYDNANLQKRIENQNLEFSYSSSLTEFQKSKKILALYKNNDAHAEKRFNEGLISLDERLKFYTDLSNYQKEYLQSKWNFYVQEYNVIINQINFL